MKMFSFPGDFAIGKGRYNFMLVFGAISLQMKHDLVEIMITAQKLLENKAQTLFWRIIKNDWSPMCFCC